MTDSQIKGVTPSAPTSGPATRIICPSWRSTLLWVETDPVRGQEIAIRCKSDRGVPHFLGCEDLLRIWAEQAAGQGKNVEKARIFLL